jgi:tRNA (guanine37-N1)-methyltransferase
MLLSGHHANVKKWRNKESLIRTLERRPDLLEGRVLSKEEKIWVAEWKKQKQEQEQ